MIKYGWCVGLQKRGYNYIRQKVTLPWHTPFRPDPPWMCLHGYTAYLIWLYKLISAIGWIFNSCLAHSTHINSVLVLSTSLTSLDNSLMYVVPDSTLLHGPLPMADTNSVQPIFQDQNIQEFYIRIFVAKFTKLIL